MVLESFPNSDESQAVEPPLAQPSEMDVSGAILEIQVLSDVADAT
jgi:hypothetical protein